GAVAELAAGDDDAEDGGEQHAEPGGRDHPRQAVHGGQARDDVAAEADGVPRPGGDQHADQRRERSGRGQEPVVHADGPELQELGTNEPGHAGTSLVSGAAVSWKKTSSRLATSVVLSKMGTPRSAATTATCSGVVPVISSRSPSMRSMRTPSPWRAPASSVALGVRIRMVPRAPAVSSSRDECATSLPWSTMTTLSTVWATSARMWLDT